MSGAPDDGGPAFPGQWDHGQGQVESWTGMSLRDYFAAEAMKALIACEGPSYVNDLANGYRGGRTVALAALMQADAMLAARKERAS